MRDWIDAFGVLHLGWTVALLLLMPTAVGLVVDRRFGTTPWALVAGALVGIVVATFGVTRLVIRRYERLAPPFPKEGDR